VNRDKPLKTCLFAVFVRFETLRNTTRAYTSYLPEIGTWAYLD